MYSKILFTLLLYHLISTSLFSQEIKKGEVYAYARKIVDTMASESMHGRGYVNGGDSIAANYLKTEFKKIGLKSFGSDYYQRLSFAINTFPGEIYLINNRIAVEDQPYIAGSTYLVSPDCPSIKGKFKIALVGKNNLTSALDFEKIMNGKFKKTFLLLDSVGVKDKNIKKYFETIINAPPKNVKGILIYSSIYDISCLDHSCFSPWSVSQKVRNIPVVKIMKWPNPSSQMTFNGDVNNFEKVTLTIQNKFIPNHPSQNVIGYIQGSVYPDSFIVYSAHYDHLGHMGKDVYFPGANDNASGCAMLLNLANYYSKSENKPKYSIAFMAFCGEEVGLLGSKYYTENPLFPLKNIKFVFNMDIMGTGEEGITVVNGTIFKTEFDKLKDINTQNNFIKDVKIRGKSANSDHYHFSEKGVKAFFIYSMGGIKAYHDIYDRPETLPLNEFENMFKLITKFGDYLQN